jgi:hypothetical protein
MPHDLDQHFRVVAKALGEGRVVLLLGAGVNLCGRRAEERWAYGAAHLPSGAELADYLAHEFEVTDLVGPHERTDLVRVAQTVATVNGRAWLYQKLHAVFDGEYEPTPAHRFLARLPAALRARGSAPPYQLLLTTNFDDTLEKAFAEAEEPYDLVWYAADPEESNRGRFWHWPPPQSESAPRIIERPNEYVDISLDERTVILKFHGAVDRADSARDSYVITEDHYIEYLSRTHVSNLIPAELVAKLTRSHFLFLAYALRDWNVRVILHRIWSAQPLDYPSWAVQRHTHPVDARLWAKRGVDILDVDLEEYVGALAERMGVAL